MNASGERIRSLYRSHLRQVRALPHSYLRHFFRIKGGDDFRLVLQTKAVGLRRGKLRRVFKDLQRLRAANAGEHAAFDHMLDIAYGRVGKLRRELIEPLLLDPNTLLRQPTNQRKEKIRPPDYSPELAALLTSSISRTTKALQSSHLVSPPGLPQHAPSVSEGTALLRPFSRRRKYNIQWRFFNKECKKVYPPLQTSVQHLTDLSDTHIIPNNPISSGFHNTVAFQELLTLAGSPSRPPEPPSKQVKLKGSRDMPDTVSVDGVLPSRWLRRRYQALLGRIPLLTSRFPLQNNFKRTYDVQLADSATIPSRSHSSRLRVIDAKSVAWMSDVHLAVQSRRRCK